MLNPNAFIINILFFNVKFLKKENHIYCNIVCKKEDKKKGGEKILQDINSYKNNGFLTFKYLLFSLPGWEKEIFLRLCKKILENGGQLHRKEAHFYICVCFKIQKRKIKSLIRNWLSLGLLQRCGKYKQYLCLSVPIYDYQNLVWLLNQYDKRDKKRW